MSFLNDISHWYFSKRSLPYWGIYAIDSLILLLSGCGIYFLDYGVTGVVRNYQLFAYLLLISWVAYSVGFRLFHTYSGIIRYSSFVDLQRVAYANLVGLGLTSVIYLLLQELFDLSVYRFVDNLMIFFFVTVWMWAFRVIIKSLFDMS